MHFFLFCPCENDGIIICMKCPSFFFSCEPNFKRNYFTITASVYWISSTIYLIVNYRWNLALIRWNKPSRTEPNRAEPIRTLRFLFPAQINVHLGSSKNRISNVSPDFKALLFCTVFQVAFHFSNSKCSFSSREKYANRSKNWFQRSFRS